MARSANLEIMLRAATRAARVLARDFGEVEQLQVSIKGPGDFVSAADRKAEQVIREELRRRRPDYGFVMEESGVEAGRSPHNRWIVDPLDGTTNFLHGLPHWAISIALEQHGELTAGIVFDPLRNELFRAEKGYGAYLNDRRLRVSRRSDIRMALIGCGLPIQNWKGRELGFTRQMNRVADECGGLRRLGTASLDMAYVAAGRLGEPVLERFRQPLRRMGVEAEVSAAMLAEDLAAEGRDHVLVQHAAEDLLVDRHDRDLAQLGIVEQR